MPKEFVQIRTEALLDLLSAIDILTKLYQDASKNQPPTQDEVNRLSYLKKLVLQSHEYFEEDNP